MEKTARRQNLSTEKSGGTTPEPREILRGRKPSNLKLFLVGLFLVGCHFRAVFRYSWNPPLENDPFAVSGSEQSAGAPASARRSSGGRKFARPLIE
jgi:hypothetical protein